MRRIPALVPVCAPAARVRALALTVPVAVVLAVVLAMIVIQPARPWPAPSSARVVASQSAAVAPPGSFHGTARQAGLLVVGERTIPTGVIALVRRLVDVAGLEQVGVGSVMVLGRSVVAAAVDPTSYRRLTDEDTARATAVWEAVARGELATTHALADGLSLPLGGEVSVGAGSAATQERIGAIATTVPGIDLVVNRVRGRGLGLPSGNGLVVALAHDADVVAAGEILGDRLGERFSVTVTAEHSTVAAASRGRQFLAARLAGGSVGQAVGGFSYTLGPNGTVAPDPAWVSASIVSGEVPILGQVTCNRVMFDQLRGALQEVVDAGLASALDPGDYGGCYVPRFIDRDPSRGLSLHTWGIAIDFNVSGNQVGTSGDIDRRIVDIFARWGFAWGGTWRVPDPMHFELAALLQTD